MAGVIYEKKVHEDYTHFSVRQSYLIGGLQFRPSVCYAIPTGLEDTIEKMEKEGMARRYTQEMRFISGIPRPVRS